MFSSWLLPGRKEEDGALSPLLPGIVVHSNFNRLLIKVIVGPWLHFTLFSLCYAYLWYSLRYVLILCSAVTLAANVTRCVLRLMSRLHDRAYICALCGVAIVLGSVAGWHNFTMNTRHYHEFGDRRHYTNVWPEESADSHRDASALVFSASVKPDVSMALAYHAVGSTYCVAPIKIWGVQPKNPVQYWSAGKDCCNSRGKYKCDDTWVPKARGGLVISNGDLPYYQQAAKIAAATVGLTSAPEPIFVQWVLDLGRARNKFLEKAAVFWALTSFTYLPICFVFALGAPTVVKLLTRSAGR
mmetsp:Transcript_116124/g.231544  ORF Transcript_116124/g.231544 Transcript_116124/m.231544 type:complete len:299 (+) Transcript_116124:75-971(+)